MEDIQIGICTDKLILNINMTPNRRHEQWGDRKQLQITRRSLTITDEESNHKQGLENVCCQLDCDKLSLHGNR